MAQAELKDDFKFPHEAEEEAKGKPEAEDDGGFEVEIENDTPRRDRGRKPDETPPEDPTEDELS